MARKNSRKDHKPVAKGRQARAKRRGPKLPESFELAFKELLRRTEVAAFGASTVMGALLHQNMGRDGEIAVCVEQLVAETLEDIIEEGAALACNWCITPYAPVLRSVLLGMRRARRLRRS